MARYTKASLKGFVRKGFSYYRPLGEREWVISHREDCWRVRLMPVYGDKPLLDELARTLAGAVRLADFYEPMIKDTLADEAEIEAGLKSGNEQEPVNAV